MHFLSIEGMDEMPTLLILYHDSWYCMGSQYYNIVLLAVIPPSLDSQKALDKQNSNENAECIDLYLNSITKGFMTLILNGKLEI